MKYEFFVRFPFGGHRHEIESNDLKDAVEQVRSRYKVTDDRAKKMYIITSAFCDGDKVVSEVPLF